jgi:hypothetical protein
MLSIPWLYAALQDLEARRLRNESSMQGTAVELSHRLLATPTAQIMLGGIP